MTTWMRAGLAKAAGLLFLLGGPVRAGEVVFSVGTSGPVQGCAGCSAAGQAHAAFSTGNCGGPRVPCPPPFCHVTEGPPCIKYKKGCPRPICDPCHLEHFGYYPTCWSPWPYPPNWSHCPYPTASVMLPAPHVPPFTPKLYGARPDTGTWRTVPSRIDPNNEIGRAHV